MVGFICRVVNFIISNEMLQYLSEDTFFMITQSKLQTIRIHSARESWKTFHPDGPPHSNNDKFKIDTIFLAHDFVILLNWCQMQ